MKFTWPPSERLGMRFCVGLGGTSSDWQPRRFNDRSGSAMWGIFGSSEGTRFMKVSEHGVRINGPSESPPQMPVGAWAKGASRSLSLVKPPRLGILHWATKPAGPRQFDSRASSGLRRSLGNADNGAPHVRAPANLQLGVLEAWLLEYGPLASNSD